ncbi:ATP-dependent RNA helicase dbp6, partial [Borealophlyctis nickersoniae]
MPSNGYYRNEDEYADDEEELPLSTSMNNYRGFAWQGTRRKFDDEEDETPVKAVPAVQAKPLQTTPNTTTSRDPVKPAVAKKDDIVVGDPKRRKKKRGGKKQKEKELKWKVAHGIEVKDENTVGKAGGDGQSREETVTPLTNGTDGDRGMNGKKEDEKSSRNKRKKNEEAPIPKKRRKKEEEGTETDSSNSGSDDEDTEKDGDATNLGVGDGNDSTHPDNEVADDFHSVPAKLKPSKLAGLPAWLAHPLTISPDLSHTSETAITNPVWHLSPRTIARLTDQNITHLFPVQAAVLPRLLATRYSSAPIPPGDLCVAAPTGSGKTLAYALPIVESLSTRIVPRLRALVLLPTRDLALQVKAVFDSLLKGTDIKVALVTGSTSFAVEQSMLVAKDKNVVWTEGDGGSSKIDILVATPGRLMDHLNGTEGFTLRHLRFLVIDEADRLLNQSYQDWLSHVLKAADPSIPAPASLPTTAIGLPLHSVTTTRHSIPNVKHTNHISVGTLRHTTPLQKLLFSATLTRNPSKIASLHLHAPTYIAVSTPAESNDTNAEPDDTRYITPATLTEHLLVTSTVAEKPLALFYLLYTLRKRSVLIFTKSIESAHRLASLIQFFGSAASFASSFSNPAPLITAEAFTSDLPPATRKAVLARFRDGELPVLVCSDIVSRGIDIPSAACIVNYDPPARTKT